MLTRGDPRRHLSELAGADPDKARAWLRRLLVEEGGLQSRVARRVGVSRSFLSWWMCRLGMAGEADAEKLASVRRFRLRDDEA